MIKLALIGYGKMGKVIEAIAEKDGFEVVVKINSINDWKINGIKLKDADVAIEFSTPAAVADNIRRCFDYCIPVISGTTGWEDQLEEIRNECISAEKTLFISPNFSIGVNVFFLVNRFLAEMMNPLEQYDLSVEEIHHLHKLDAPSGTAKVLANDLIKLIDRKTEWVNHESAVKSALSVISRRIGEVPGTHFVSYSSEVDEIEIRHIAKNRAGFAIGVLMAARWVIGKKGYFTMDDLMRSIFAKNLK